MVQVQQTQDGTRGWTRGRITLALLVVLPVFALSSCFCRGPGCMWSAPPPPPQRGAGLWDVRLPSGDINAEVGHPFAVYVSGACESATAQERWSYNLTYSGSLPPGVTLGDDRLSGIPSQRGHYIVHLKLSNSVCLGESKQNHEEELRIHVTGSGKVLD
jgi:hypothetical protein